MTSNQTRGTAPESRPNRWSQASFARASLVTWLVGGTLLVGGPMRAAEPPGPADDLVRLVPTDATVVVSVEGLRDHIQTIRGSRLVAGLRQLPAVRTWLESDKHQSLKRSLAEVEKVLHVSLAELRDGLLGDAVVLALRMDSQAPIDPARARGLLLLRARDPALLERLIASLNAAQKQGGELERVGDHMRDGTTYHVREFLASSSRPPEWYVSYPDGTFAFSNSEDILQGVIDRKSARGTSGPGTGRNLGLGDSPRHAAVRRRLGDHSLAQVYIDPRAVERLLALAPPAMRPLDARVMSLLKRHLAAVDYAGAALVWGPEAIVVHAVETLEPSRVDNWLRRWAGDTRICRPELRRVPSSTLALAAAHVDLFALRELVYHVVPEPDHPRLRNIEVALSGLLLGQQLTSKILPALGPGAVAYLDEPEEPGDARGRLFPLVVVVDLRGGRPGPDPGPTRRGPADPPVPDAVENALRTFLALMALDEKRGHGRSEIQTTESAGTAVTTLGTPIPFAYAVDRPGGRLVLGTSAPSVARYLASSADPSAGARFRDLQATAFAEYETFVCIDMAAVARLVDRYRDRLAGSLAARQRRTPTQVEGDLEQVVALARLFRAVFVAHRIEPDASAMHRTFGAITEPAEGASDRSREP